MDLLQEVLNLLDDVLRYNLMHGWLKQTKVENLLESHNIELEFIDSFGGEGQGENFWSVWGFNRGDESVMIKFDGYWTSHYGAEYYESFEVEEREVVRKEYYRKTK